MDTTDNIATVVFTAMAIFIVFAIYVDIKASSAFNVDCNKSCGLHKVWIKSNYKSRSDCYCNIDNEWKIQNIPSRW